MPARDAAALDESHAIVESNGPGVVGIDFERDQFKRSSGASPIDERGEHGGANTAAAPGFDAAPRRKRYRDCARSTDDRAGSLCASPRYA